MRRITTLHVLAAAMLAAAHPVSALDAGSRDGAAALIIPAAAVAGAAASDAGPARVARNDAPHPVASEPPRRDDSRTPPAPLAVSQRRPSLVTDIDNASAYPSAHPLEPSPTPTAVSVSPLVDPALRESAAPKLPDPAPTSAAPASVPTDRTTQQRPGDASYSSVPPGRTSFTIEAAPASPTPAEATDRRVAPPQARGAQPATDAAAKAPPVYKNLWDRMRAGFTIPNLESPLVDRHTEWYASRPDYMRRVVERGRKYLHFVVEEVEKRGMPLEIALLPMIESAYNPTAYSKAHASGIWQFIPGTGRTFGLKQNWWYDGRRDVTAATRAALDYLEKLHGMFGDWRLALAAYNWGEGAVTRAIERNQRQGLPTDYESLRMPEETRNYIPKLQAVKNLVVEPERYGLALDEVPNQPYFIRVAAPGQIDFKRAAQLANVPLEEFRSLNPAYNRPVITQSGDGSLLIPADKAEIFSANLTKALDGPLVSWQTYRLPKNERLEAIAARFGTTVAQIQQVNGIKQHGRLRAGSTLLLPLGGGQTADPIIETAVLEPTTFALPEPVAAPRSYRVRPGDTLRGIAERNHVTVRQLMDWNHLRFARVRTGQTVLVSAVVRHPAPPQRIASARADRESDRAVRGSDRKKGRHAVTAKGESKHVAADRRGEGRRKQSADRGMDRGAKKVKAVAEKHSRNRSRVAGGASTGREHIARR